jgi:hypothetical protein
MKMSKVTEITGSDIEITLRRLRMESHKSSAPTGMISLIDTVLLSTIPLDRLAEILSQVADERSKHLAQAAVEMTPAQIRHAQFMGGVGDEVWD